MHITWIAGQIHPKAGGNYLCAYESSRGWRYVVLEYRVDTGYGDLWWCAEDSHSHYNPQYWCEIPAPIKD